MQIGYLGSRMRNIHISTKLQFKGYSFSVDHGEGEIFQWHLSIADKNIWFSISTDRRKSIRADSVHVRKDA